MLIVAILVGSVVVVAAAGWIASEADGQMVGAAPPSAADLRAPSWTLGRRGPEAELRLAGDWIARRSGVRPANEARGIVAEVGNGTLRIDCRELGHWDSALVAFLRMVRDEAQRRERRADRRGQPSRRRPGGCSLWHPLPTGRKPAVARCDASP